MQVCGDAHLSNFGTYAGPDRRLLFDLNDFDETIAGPWEWDLKRLATSFVIVGRDRGFTTKINRHLARTAVRAYRETMAACSALGNLDVWYLRVDVESGLDRIQQEATSDPGRSKIANHVEKEARRELKLAWAAAAKAKRRDGLRALSRLTETVDGQARFRSEPPLLVPLDQLVGSPDGAVLESVLDSYRDSLPADCGHLFDHFTVRDWARKVVGVGSVGTPAWVLLLLGAGDTDPLILQAKEAGPSVLAPYVDASAFDHEGRRVIEGQRMLQSASDIFLGWCSGPGVDGRRREYYLRQLWDWKGSADVDRLNHRQLLVYAQLCGGTLARAHARSGDRIAISGYLGKGDMIDGAVAAFAERYADQNQRDYERFMAAIADGHITIEHR